MRGVTGVAEAVHIAEQPSARRSINISLSAQVSCKIAPIFSRQRIGVILGMALQEDELAAKGFGENVDAVHRRTRQYAIVSEFKVALQKAVVSRVRGEAHEPSFADQRMILPYREGEHAGAFLGQGPTFDPVEVQDRCASGETREDR
jgi:hypothetical protein